MSGRGEQWRLIGAWAIMAGLTLAAIFVGHARSETSPGRIGVAVLLTLTLAKAWLLLSHYLELRHAPTWNKALRAMIAALLAAIYALTLASLSA